MREQARASRCFTLPDDKGGRVRISFNSLPFGTVTLSGKDYTVELEKADISRKSFRSLPAGIRSLKVVRFVSRILDRTGFSVVFRDEKGFIVGMGSGHHSILGDIDFSVLRTLKYFR